MYSPKISEEFVPVLFRVALSQKRPMTKLVNEIIGDYLQKNAMMREVIGSHDTENQLGGLQGTETSGQYQGDLGPLRPSVIYATEER